MTLYPEILKVLRILLEKSDNTHWANWITQDIEEWNRSKSTKHHLSAYGGMGSINDLWVGGNDIKGSWKNEIFDHSKSLAYALAQRKGMGGSELVGISPNRHRAVIQGWRCLECGYGEVSKVEIESYIANKFVPILLRQKIESGDVCKIVNISELTIEEQVVEHRRKVISAVEKSEIRLIERADKWMQPCPNCDSDNTAVYRWNFNENSDLGEITPSSDNLKLKTEKKTLHNNKYWTLGRWFKFWK
ncbi:DUF6966 domain-containing protein [Marinifilum fragile]|uniref:DUF6966 domain-containing protein n=1 Tax=Marinifilum fragile TaxID=570161 RepID=UPI002AAC2A6C|nr:hypothetical protein [Marinifilum fragile]